MVEVTLEAIEDGYGETRLSREKAKRTKVWDYLKKAADTDTAVQGTITNKIKGGFIVDFDGVTAFLPGSLVAMRPVRDASHLSGRTLDFKVIKIDPARNNAVVSRRAVVAAENSSEREDLFKNIKKGSELIGIVKNLTDYGAFLDLGGVDGLLHITDMSWARIRHPSHILKVGQEVKVKVLEYDKEKMRVSLGLKQMQESPWEDITKRYKTNSIVPGRVTNITDYGCFVEIDEGIEGLVHVSEMDWSNKNIHPSKVVSSNQNIDVMILEIDTERRRLSLGIKQTKLNPWEQFAKQHKKGDILTGTIKLVTDFGIFIHFKEFGIDGLVHVSDTDRDEKTADKKITDIYKKGKKQEVIVLAIDPGRERISLGIKQLLDKKRQDETPSDSHEEADLERSEPDEHAEPDHQPASEPVALQENDQRSGQGEEDEKPDTVTDQDREIDAAGRGRDS